MRGKVKCGKLQYGCKNLPQLEGYETIDVTSRSRWRRVSPMHLGPFRIVEPKLSTTYYEDGLHPGFSQSSDPTMQEAISQNMENWWQYSKIYNIDLDCNGEVLPTFFERRAQGFADCKAKRRAVSKDKGYSVAIYLEGSIRDYQSSREFYRSTYTFLVKQTKEYQALSKKLNRGINLYIVGYTANDANSYEAILAELLSSS